MLKIRLKWNAPQSMTSCNLMRRGILLLLSLATATAPESVVWRFDSLESIGGHQTTVEGSPRIIRTAGGPAIDFNGIADAIFVETHPLEGAEKFSWEVVFRPGV